MSNFTYKDIYIEDGKRVLEMNILPEKFCNFDCIFCPIGRSHNKIDIQQTFSDISESLNELEHKLMNNEVDLVFINSKGEALVNDKIENVINLVKSKGLAVRLLSNGYILGRVEYMKIANKCDEVIGEIKVITDKDFQKIQRPIDGYTFHEHISSMISFNKQYKGKFILEITILKGYNDSEEAICRLKNIIDELSPDKIIIERMDDDRFKEKLGISDERFHAISKALLNK
ncbi:radical SAM protein [Clostridium estertheticum]|uniref:radical SAM protein n=1 Tax=Clostridium estertheticum TaxID=238834 RepID=UPI001C0AD448|nr:radical SAM protein [Clostridium estertheticum]MBU3177303.1 radical SAM protein [Clostridium estertheticum]